MVFIQLGITQQDYALIKIFNPKKGIVGIGSTPIVEFDGKEIVGVQSGGTLVYKKFIEGPLKIGLITPMAGFAGRKVVHQDIYVEKGKELNIKLQLSKRKAGIKSFILQAPHL